MRHFTATELARMQATQEGAMQDIVLHLKRQVTTPNPYGMIDEGFLAEQSYICGFKPIAKDEGMTETEVPMVDAKLRMALAVESVIGPYDRLQLTHRFNAELDSKPIFSIVGLPERGPSCLIFNLKLVTE